MDASQGTATSTTQTTGSNAESAKNPAQTGAQAAQGNTNPAEMTRAEAREAIRKLKIQYDDGKEEEVDEDEVLKTYKERKNHQRVANKELQEGKAAKRQAEEFITKMKDKATLFDAIKKLGHDPRKLSEEFLASVLDEEMMDPKDRELKTTKARLEEYEAKEKAAKEAEEKRLHQLEVEKYKAQFNEQFVEALKNSKLPANKHTVSRMADWITRASRAKETITPAEAAKLVEQDLERENAAILASADPETLVRLLGEPTLQKIRAYDTSKLKNPEANLKTPIQQGDINSRTTSAGKEKSWANWRAYNKK